MRNRVCVFIASSVDGFIAGVDDDLSWLPAAETGEEENPHPSVGDPNALEYEEFIEGVGALLMGRRTYDVVRGFGIPWPYGDLPVLVATSRPLDTDPPPKVEAVDGPPQLFPRDGAVSHASKEDLSVGGSDGAMKTGLFLLV